MHHLCHRLRLGLSRLWDKLSVEHLAPSRACKRPARKRLHWRFTPNLQTLEVREVLSGDPMQAFDISLLQNGSALIQDFRAFSSTGSDQIASDTSMPVPFQACAETPSADSQFQSQGDKFQLLLDTSAAATMILPSAAGNNPDEAHDTLRLGLLGANATSPFGAQSSAPLSGSSEATGFQTNDGVDSLNSYFELWYQNVYDGIDESFAATQDTLTFNFFVHPFADASQLTLSYTGAEDLQLDSQGNLLIRTQSHFLMQTAPVAFQQIGGEFHSVQSGYVLADKGQVSIRLGDYDPTNLLVIDPNVQIKPPVAYDNSYSVAHDHTLSVSAPGVLGNDVFNGGSQFTAVLVATTSHGSLSLSSDGSFTYTPSYLYLGQDSFTYKDYNGTSYSNVATVSLNVTNSPPLAVTDAFEGLHDTTITGNVLANDIDSDDTVLTATLVGGPAHALSFALSSNGNFSYTPLPGWTGGDTFTYQAHDSVGGVSGTTTVTIAVKTEVQLSFLDYQISANWNVSNLWSQEGDPYTLPWIDVQVVVQGGTAEGDRPHGTVDLYANDGGTLTHLGIGAVNPVNSVAIIYDLDSGFIGQPGIVLEAHYSGDTFFTACNDTDLGVTSARVRDDPPDNDNPTITSSSQGLTVVIVGGYNGAERRAYRQQARDHYGGNAYIISNVHSVIGLGSVLSWLTQDYEYFFPDHSISRLVLASHGNPYGVQLDQRGNAASLLYNENVNEIADAMRRALSNNALIDLQTCAAAALNFSDGSPVGPGVGEDNMRRIATLLGVRVRGNRGCVTWFEVGDGAWITVP
ncbi:MAG: Ig-like domain-containing protein [Planctomycetes bacterium]|nr:Ig-like domain-containing protein [Planctomycetota bacterium]